MNRRVNISIPYKHKPITTLILSIIMMLMGPVLYAQDLHFSQFFNSPLSTNPANTGFIPSSDFRIGANIRSQWTSIPVPYKTNSIWGDAQVWRDRIPGGWIGLGGLILQDVAGSGNLRSTKVYSSIAYHQMLGNTGLLSAGFNLGYASKQIDITKLTFNSQWNGQFFDGSRSDGIQYLSSSSIGYFDMQAGLNYAMFPSDNIYIHGGFSLHHLNKPVESFFLDSSGHDNQIKPRSIFFADAMIKINDRIILSPSMYYTRQAKSSEFVGGMHLNYNIKEKGEHQLIAGVYFRPNESLIPMVGYQWRSFRFMFSYDVTSSPLKYFNGSQGATELSLQYDGMYGNYNGDRRQSFCPSF